MNPNNPTAILFEDVALTRRTTRRMLERAGLQVFDMPNGLHAEEAVRKHSPDIVVTDLAMPERSRLEVIRALKQAFPYLPVLAFTGMSIEDIALRAGANAVLLKPSSANEFERVVKSLLSGRILSRKITTRG